VIFHPKNRLETKAMTTFTDTRYVIAVHSLQASADYYRDVLGFAVHKIDDPGWLFFDRDNCHIMAGECRDSIPASQTQDHSYFAYIVVTDIDDFFQTVSQKGADLLKPVRNEPWGMREFGVRTIDGHRIMFGAPIK
jgi:predicted enzyme related to lactoylglutathione lyase